MKKTLAIVILLLLVAGCGITVQTKGEQLQNYEYWVSDDALYRLYFDGETGREMKFSSTDGTAETNSFTWNEADDVLTLIFCYNGTDKVYELFNISFTDHRLILVNNETAEQISLSPIKRK